MINPICVGICLGFGTIVGIFFDQIPFGIILGTGIGVVVGAALNANKSK